MRKEHLYAIAVYGEKDQDSRIYSGCVSAYSAEEAEGWALKLTRSIMPEFRNHQVRITLIPDEVVLAIADQLRG